MTLTQERVQTTVSQGERNHGLRDVHPQFYDLIKRTPVEREAHMLANGASLDVKHEGEQETGSFKERGAVNALLHLGPDSKSVTASAGSFAASMARAAYLLNHDTHIVTPSSIAPSKEAKLQSYSATYALYGDTFDEADAYARSFTDRAYVSPFDNFDVIMGHSTLAQELLERYGDTPLTIFVPIGGGGLVAGTLIATRGRNVRVVGVQFEGNDSVERSLQQEYGVCEASNLDSLCEGSAVRYSGELPLKIMRANSDRFEIVTVKRAHVGAMIQDELTKRDQLIPVYGEVTAMEGFPETTGVLAEAGAILYAKRNDHDGSQYVAIRTGNNVDPSRAEEALECHYRVRRALTKKTTGLTIAKGW